MELLLGRIHVMGTGSLCLSSLVFHNCSSVFTVSHQKVRELRRLSRPTYEVIVTEDHVHERGTDERVPRSRLTNSTL